MAGLARGARSAAARSPQRDSRRERVLADCEPLTTQSGEHHERTPARDRHRALRPQTRGFDDFYRHVNGGWLDANPVPPEYGSWGAAQIVHARNQDVLHQLLEDAAARTEPRGSAGQMVGDYFAAAMDEASIAAAGAAPLDPLPGAHRRRRVRRRRPRHRARPAAQRPGPAPLARHRAGLRGLGRLPRLRRPGRAGAARARLLHARRRAVGEAARRSTSPTSPGSSATSETPRSGRRRPPSASSPSRPAWPRRPTPPSRCATCSSP